jgi:hypothetical protein
VPEISRFYGIIVRMYSRGEHPPPHFHVQYGGHRASISIDGFDVLDGDLPVRAHRLIREWAGAHQAELRENWQRAQAHEPVLSIDPLS